MKRTVITLLACLTLTACAQKKEMKILVSYFSATGTTEAAAKKLADAMGADTYEIKPAVPYTAADLDWRDKNSRSTIEMQDPASRPALADKKPDVKPYDVIFVGFPIWWYTAPTIINTYLEAADFKGKTVVPFATSGGSGIDNTYKTLRTAYPDIDWKPGKLLNTCNADTLAAWKKQLGI